MPHPLQHQMMPSAVAAAATPYGMGGLPDAAARAQQVVANIRQILSPLPELVGVGSPVEGLRTAVRHVTQQEIHPAAASEMRCGSLYEARAGLLGGLGVLGWVGVPHGVGLGGSGGLGMGWSAPWGGVGWFCVLLTSDFRIPPYHSDEPPPPSPLLFRTHARITRTSERERAPPHSPQTSLARSSVDEHRFYLAG